MPLNTNSTRFQPLQRRGELLMGVLASRSIGGLNGETNRKLSQQICKLLKDSLGIAALFSR